MNFISTYLKAKHWQLFILFSLPILAPYIFFQSIFTQGIKRIEELENTVGITDDEMFLEFFNLFGYIKYFFAIIFLASIIYSFWNWSITVGLQKKIPSDLKINLTRFNIFFSISVIYPILFFLLILYFIDKIPELKTLLESDNDIEQLVEEKIFQLLSYVPLFLIFHLLAAFSFLHTIFFTSKTIKTAELQRKVKSDDFIGYFFLLWFYHIGVWIIQPKVNQIHANTTETKKKTNLTDF